MTRCRKPRVRTDERSVTAQATPKAQKLAKSKGLDLSTLAGTGRFGRVTEDDVKEALGIADPKPAAAAAAAPAAAAAAPAPAGSVPMTGMQQAIAKNMEATLSARPAAPESTNPWFRGGLPRRRRVAAPPRRRRG